MATRLDRFRAKRAAHAMFHMKKTALSFSQEMASYTAKEIAPINFSYSFGSYLASIRAFAQTAAITAYVSNKNTASNELKKAGESIKSYLSEFRDKTNAVFEELKKSGFASEIAASEKSIESLRLGN
jgi:hypothetical protein